MIATVARATSSRVRTIGIAIVILAACVPYLSTIHDYFVQDDFGVVMLFARKAWTTFPRWFTMPWTEDIWGYVPDEIRPFPALSYQVTAAWGAAAPEAHHVFNIAMHAGNALLVLAIARAVAGLSPIAALAAAVIFAILPVQAESVAWITGRVDSMPAFFYFATFLAYARWRTTGLPRLYGWSLVLFFLALFSKQTTITMVATLASYDLLVAGRPVRVSWAWLRPYVPFAAMTAGFLALRYAVVGTVVREQSLSAQGLTYFVELFGRHLHRVILGVPASPAWYMWVVIVAATVAIALLSLVRDDGTGRQHTARVAMFFGPVWWILGVAPVAVAGYESPRHVYLASLAWAVTLALGLDVLLARSTRRAWHYAVGAVAALILAVYGLLLHRVVVEWNTAATNSRHAVARLQREALATTPGSLVIIGAPFKSWEWSAPFMAQPPYTRSDLTTRVSLITPWRLHCCRGLWLDYTRTTLRTWTARTDRPPIIALYVNPRTGDIQRLTDRDYPPLRDLIPILRDTDTLDALDKGILDLLERLVGNS